MALVSGSAGQVGMATETVPGTAVTVTRFWPFRDESLIDDRERLEDEAIVAGRRVLQSNAWNGGNITIGGNIGYNLYDHSMGFLLKHAFGGVNTTGAGPYVHTFTPGDLPSKTVQVGRPGVGGTVHPFTYAGNKVASWELAMEVGAICTWGETLVGMTSTTAVALATATYAAALKPVKFNHVTVATLAGTPVALKGIKVAGDNKLDGDRRFLGTQTIAEPLETGLRDYTGSLTVEFTNLDLYNAFVAGTEMALATTFAVGSNSLAIAGNIRFDGGTPNVSGRGLLMQEIPIKFIASGADSTAITVVLTSTDVTP